MSKPMARPKKIKENITGDLPEVKVETSVKEKPNMPVMLKSTKQVVCIKPSEYDRLIHICL